MRGPSAITPVPRRISSTWEDRTGRFDPLPGSELQTANGRRLIDMRLSECRAELVTLGFPVSDFAELGKADLLAVASAYFERRKGKPFDPETLVAGIMKDAK